MMTGFGSVDTAVDATRSGAFDYISKPFKLDELEKATYSLNELCLKALDQVFEQNRLGHGTGR